MWPPLSALPVVAEMLPLCSLHMGAAGLLQSCSRDERGRLCVLRPGMSQQGKDTEVLGEARTQHVPNSWSPGTSWLCVP